MTEDAILPGSAQSRSFGEQAEHYDRLRPPYPAQAVDFVLHGRPPGRLLDVGAGTGKLTRLLIERAEQVIAVEPDGRMRVVLQSAVPTAEVLAGSAEQLPLPDASVDAVFAGQAFHWFRRPDADRELARVLRPGGVVGLLWNMPDKEVSWVPEVYQATRQPLEPLITPSQDLDLALFSPAEQNWTSWSYRLPGLAGLRALVHTWSWMITRSPAEQRAIDERLRVLATRHAELQGEAIEFPLRTKAVRQYLR
ncbi:MAG: methyltransferase domain-containing protein [Jatrophihabitantaceae bacterium]